MSKWAVLRKRGRLSRLSMAMISADVHLPCALPRNAVDPAEAEAAAAVADRAADPAAVAVGSDMAAVVTAVAVMAAASAVAVAGVDATITD